MADVITRFKLETTQYESKLRNAAKSMSEISRQAALAGNEFGKFTQKHVEAARGLGNIATSATNTRDKVKELVNAYNDLAKEYNSLTKVQQQSDFGQAMAESLRTLQGRIRETKEEMQSLGTATKQVGGGGLEQLIGGVAGQFGMSASMFTGVGAAVAGAGTAFKLIQDNVQTAMGFEKSMSALSALTGMVGQDLDRLKEYSIELGSTTTLTASQVADAFRLIGSQQPQLLSSGEALKEVTKYAITLSEAAGIDLATASQTLSTSINQMGGDSANAARYVNVLAAASQKGAGDISWLGEAIVKSGTYAKAVGTGYEELVANLETLAKAGYDASTAGTALRSIILELEKQNDDQLKPSVVGLTTAFENLSKKQLDISGYADLVNARFAAQTLTLAENAAQTRVMTEAITGTNIAEEQATTNVSNLSGAIKQLESAWEGLNLHINDSNGPLTEFINGLKDAVDWVDALVSAQGRLKQAQNERNSSGRVDSEISDLQKAKNPQQYYEQTVEDWQDEINKLHMKWKEANDDALWNPFAAWDADKYSGQMKAARKELDEYRRRAEEILHPKQAEPVKIEVDDSEVDKANNSLKNLNSTNKTNVKVTTPKTEEQQIQAQIQSLQQEYIKATEPRRAEIQVEIKGLQERQQEIQRLKDEAAGKVVVPIEYPEGSLQSMEAELKRLRDAQGKALDNYEWAAYQQAIDEATKKIGILKGELPKGMQATYTLKVNKEQLDALRRDGLFANKDIRVNVEPVGDTASTLEQLATIGGDESVKVGVELAGDSLSTVESLHELDNQEYLLTIAADTVAAVDKVGELVKDIEHQQPVIEPNVEMPQNLETLKQSIEAALNMNDVKVDTTTFTTLLRTAVKNGISDLDGDFSELFAKMGSGLNIPDDTWQTLQDEINTRLQELGIDPIKIDFETGNVKNVEKDAKGIDKSFNAAASAVQNVGNALSNLEDPGAKVAGIIAEAVANIALGFATATSKSAGGGIFGWIAAIAGGLATMTSTISAIHNVTGYATGGIVEGPSGVDKVPAMLTAGEVVLNHAQQNTLASELEGGGMQGLSLETRISAEDIRLVLNNRGRRTGKGEYIQTNFR